MTNAPSRKERSTSLLRAKIREVFHHLPRALVGEVEAIHQMRVSGRRLRTALLHLPPKPEGKRARRALRLVRDLTRAAGTGRDLDVVLERVLAEWPAGQRNPEQKVLLRRLRQTRRRGQAHLVDAVLDLDIARLRRTLRGLLSRGGDRTLAVLTRIRDTEERERRQIVTTLTELGTRYDSEALHRVRIAARRLRYAIELEAEMSRHSTEAVKLLRSLQEELGQIRDLHLVSAWFEGQVARSVAQGQGALANEARRQAAFFREKSEAEHLSLLAHDPVGRVNEVMGTGGQSTPAA
jgi:CHAD domain-containing protein